MTGPEYALGWQPATEPYSDVAEELDLPNSVARFRPNGFHWEDTIRKLAIVLIQYGFIRPQ
jgi:hypothetical protein